MATETPKDVIKRYLEDAIAAEKSFETQLRAFAREGNNQQVRRMFETHADETKMQYEQLTSRLEQLSGSPSAAKSFLAHMFNLTPSTAKLGHRDEERVTQNLMMAYAVENSEVAMYESLITVAEAAGDTATAQLARSIQRQESEIAERVWTQIPSCARSAFQALTMERVSGD
jgi:ferritin-like metal-binding protein YciE